MQDTFDEYFENEDFQSPDIYKRVSKNLLENTGDYTEDDDISEVSKERIYEQIIETVNFCIGPDFKFRPNQLDAIADIIYNVVNKINRNYILEAPTGTGKSLINIIAAKVLYDFYDYKSHILCSDLSLYDQYEKFLNEHPLFDIPCLKGQTGNFFCSLNGNDVRNGECRMAGISWNSIIWKAENMKRKHAWSCSSKCEYVKQRKRALEAPIVLSTYQLFMFCMNSPEASGQALQPKDLIFCDECHNIPEMVQNQYTPVIQEEDFPKFIECFDYAKDLPDVYDSHGCALSDGEIYRKYDRRILEETFKAYWEKLRKENQKQDDLYKTIMGYGEVLDTLGLAVKRIQPYIATLRDRNEGHLEKEDSDMFKLSNWFANYQCFMHDFSCAVYETGPKYVLKDVDEIEETDIFSLEPTKKIVSVHCMKEDYMVYNYLLKHAKFRICTSATAGTQENTIDTFGLYLEEGNNGCIFNRIESGFDFSKSPIYAIMSYSMGKNYIDENLPKVGDMIMKLLTITFPTERGIIQTGSYKNAKRLFDMAPPEVKERMLLYRGSKEKTAAIEEHKKSKNTILVGPTLFEGIDLPGDLCRFIIVAKVPYPSLGSNLNRKKIELFPDWYQNLTSTVLIQGIGRGVRYNGDWCKTYIMDNCFRRLYRNTKDQYSEEMQKRIKFRG